MVVEKRKEFKEFEEFKEFKEREPPAVERAFPRPREGRAHTVERAVMEFWSVLF